MKLQRTETPVQRGGVKTESTFRIQTSAHAFEILSSGLYTDSVSAIVRELSCNAYDSHVDAGKRDVPFDIHVPTGMEPWFSIRDYGTGLSNDDVLSIYTTYFQSTKSNSDDFIGALGLGSKSPFAYTNDFQVTSFFEGVEYKYAVFLNEQGVPSVALMGEAVTDQPNGIEVRLPSEERRRFTDAISKYLAYFIVKPNLLGIDLCDVDKMYTDVRQPAGSELDVDGKWFVADKDRGYYSSRTGIVYGQVPYPANVDKIISGCKQDYNPAHASGGEGYEPLCTDAELSFYRSFSDQLVLIFKVGDLSITANREELKYDEQTLEAIAGRIKEFYAKFFDGVKTAIETFADNDSLYKTNRYLMTELFNGEQRFYKSIAFDLIDCPEFVELKKHRSNWGNGFSLHVTEAVSFAKLYDVTKLETYHSQTSYDLKIRNPKGGAFDCLGIQQEIVYYVIDDTRNGAQKAKQHFAATRKDKPGAVFIVLKPRDLKSCDDAAHKLQIEEMREALGKPDFIFTSTLDYEKPVRAKSTVSRKQVGTVFTGGPHWSSKSDLDMAEGGIYIYLAGGNKIYKGSKAIPENDIFYYHGKSSSFFRNIVSTYNEVHGTEYASCDLVGVSAADIKLFDKDDNWTNILPTVEDYVKANQAEMQRVRHEYDTTKESMTSIGSTVSYDFLPVFKELAEGMRSSAKAYRQIITGQVGSNSDLMKAITKYNSLSAKLDDLRDNATKYESLLHVFADSDYKSSTPFDNRYKVSMDDDINALVDQYPLMGMLQRYCDLADQKPLQNLIDYIIMVDNNNTSTTNTTGNP